MWVISSGVKSVGFCFLLLKFASLSLLWVGQSRTHVWLSPGVPAHRGTTSAAAVLGDLSGRHTLQEWENLLRSGRTLVSGGRYSVHQYHPRHLDNTRRHLLRSYHRRPLQWWTAGKKTAYPDSSSLLSLLLLELPGFRALEETRQGGAVWGVASVSASAHRWCWCGAYLHLEEVTCLDVPVLAVAMGLGSGRTLGTMAISAEGVTGGGGRRCVASPQTLLLMCRLFFNFSQKDWWDPVNKATIN